MRDWTGGKTFYRERDFLDFVHALAVKYDKYGCTSLDNCAWDPRDRRAVATDQFHSDDYNEFFGPDNRRYIWGYIADRNQWFIPDRDRNVASYVIFRNFTTAPVHGQADG